MPKNRYFLILFTVLTVILIITRQTILAKSDSEKLTGFILGFLGKTLLSADPGWESRFLNDQGLLLGQASVDGSIFLSGENDGTSQMMAEEGTILSDTKLVTDAIKKTTSFYVYKVQAKDTLSGIAKKFKISVDTIRYANNLAVGKAIKKGDSLIILPMNGVIHELQSGETIEDLALAYKISADKIYDANKGKVIIEGVELIIPGGKPLPKKAIVKSIVSKDYFLLPVKGGNNLGKIHSNNAVDILASCNSDVLASAEGLVSKTGDIDKWNDGAGGFIEIEHLNGKVKTLYSHTSKNLVKEGDYVSRGEKIAEVGKTGNVVSLPSCHLHFEVAGVENYFAK